MKTRGLACGEPEEMRWGRFTVWGVMGFTGTKLDPQWQGSQRGSDAIHLRFKKIAPCRRAENARGEGPRGEAGRQVGRRL